MRPLLSFVAAFAFACTGAMAAPAVCPDAPGVMDMHAGADGWSVSSTHVSADGLHAYQAGFQRDSWSGSLKKFNLAFDPAGAGAPRLGQPQWDAGEALANMPAAARKIYTTGGDAGTIEFTAATLPPAQKAMLKGDATLIDYLRGERSHEAGQPNGTLRARNRVLGDIVNSAPLPVGAPGPARDDAAHRRFVAAHRDRPQAIYAGANDGMLHAFNAADGAELFAFIPAPLLAALPQLAKPDYTHRAYVDGGIVSAETRIGGEWKTVLAAGMGAGAPGVFALDISNPADFAAGAGALWEFTATDDAGMGQVAAAPAIATFKTEDGYRDFVVAASGQPAALFLLALDKPRGEPWRLGGNYFRFAIPGTDNTLGPPAIALAEDGAVSYAYAGDLRGALWRFDFNGKPPWQDARGDAPLFVAMDDADKRQPIAQQPQVVFAPGGYLVLFGTGQYRTRDDALAANFGVQSFYAIHDAPGAGPVSGRRALSKRETGPGDRVRGDAFLYGAGDGGARGWYLDFADSARSGERSVSAPLVEAGRLYFNTLIPPPRACEAGGGRMYALDALTGLSAKATGLRSAVGIPGAPVLVQSAREGAASAATAARMVVTAGSGDGALSATTAAVAGGSRAGRLGWREILNWLELRDAAD